jgi:type I restriction enzyme R subunit
VPGDSKDYERDHAVDLAKLLAFLGATQPKVVEQLAVVEDGPKRLQFLARLQGEIAKRGVVDALRKGIDHGPAHVDLFYGTPSPGNPKAVERFAANIFSVTRQLRYSKDETQLALDLGLFINGLPIATFELKNRLSDHTELFKQFQDNPQFKRWLADTVFSATYTGAPSGTTEQRASQ